MFLGVVPTDIPKFPERNPKPTAEQIKQIEVQAVVESAYNIRAPYVMAAEKLFEQGITSTEVFENTFLGNVHRTSVGNYLRSLERGIVRPN